MKKTAPLTILAAMVLAPPTGAAQVADHVSMSLGFGLSSHIQPTHRSWLGFGLSAGIGLGISFRHDDYHHDDYHYGPHRPLWTRPLHCWDPFWYDPLQPCHSYFAVGYPVHDYWGWPGWGWSGWGWRSPWQYGFLGWPSARYVRSHWWGSPFWTRPHAPLWLPFWADDYAWGYGEGWGYGYDRWDRYDDYRYTTVARRSPLYGPRYKEYPTPPVYVTDNGPERPVSRAVPRTVRGPGGGVDDGYRNPRGARLTDAPRTARPRSGVAAGTARPRTGTDVRTTRPRTGTDARTTPPRVRARPQATPRTRVEPPKRETPQVRSAPSSRRPAPIVRSVPSRRPTPAARPTPSRRPTPAARPTPSRRPTPTARPTPSRRPSPTVRSAPSRRPAPRMRSAPSRAPKPKARAAPSRAPKPKARAAPRGSGGRKAPPRRPARRPGA